MIWPKSMQISFWKKEVPGPLSGARKLEVSKLSVKDPQTGTWTILIREDSKNGEISIAVGDYPKDRRYFAKTARFTSLFKKTKDKKAYYSYVRMTQCEGKRIRQLILNKEERKNVPYWLRNYFTLKIYSNMVTKGKNSPAKDNLVALINGSASEDLARFFLGTRVWPLTQYYEKTFSK